LSGDQLKGLLDAVARGRLGVADAMQRLRALPFEQLSFATVDHHRAVRCGHPEVIFCPGKTPAQIVQIATRLADAGGQVLATRAAAEQLAALREAFPDALVAESAGAVLVNARQAEPEGPRVAVISAGTSDQPVAEEALITLRSMGAPVERIADVGVSGIHRLLAHVPLLQQCCAAVVIAGMEGALPSVVGGLVACPVFAVPTSVGYGASLGGLAALLAMLNSCASNVSVVNIDNGFGAAFAAGLVWQQVRRFAPDAR
jgi:NCAIR mutase (PurE)-related protein